MPSQLRPQKPLLPLPFILQTTTHIVALQGLACICEQGEALVKDTENHHRVRRGHSFNTDRLSRRGTAPVEGHLYLAVTGYTFVFSHDTFNNNFVT